MTIAMKDVTTVLFALHLEYAQGITLDLDGTCSHALGDAVLPLSLPEPDDPPLTVNWQALVKMNEALA